MQKKVKLTCSILLLEGNNEKFEKSFTIKRGSSKYYKKISELVYDTLKRIPDMALEDKDIRDHHEWRNGSIELPVEDYGLLHFHVKYYKSRIIVKTSIEIKDDCFKNLFKQARRFWEKIEESWENIHEQMEKSCGVLKFFRYPLIEIGKKYYSSEFEELEREAMTTFFYEVHDPYVGYIESHKVLIRFSRPSIITSEMSDHSRSNLINAIYHSCLHPIRTRNSKRNIRGYKSFLNYDEYSNARDFFENIFYKNQAAVSQITESRYIMLLTAILSIAAIATILAIIYVIPLYNGSFTISEEEIKSFIGIILLILVAVVLAPFWPRGLFRKIFKIVKLSINRQDK